MKVRGFFLVFFFFLFISRVLVFRNCLWIGVQLFYFAMETNEMKKENNILSVFQCFAVFRSVDCLVLTKCALEHTMQRKLNLVIET